jgi:hypothetical protein
MNEFSEEELIFTYLSEENSILNFLILFDFVVVIMFFCFLNPANNKIRQLKGYLYSFFIVDGLISLIHKHSLNNITIQSELLISLLFSIQFLLVIFCLEKITHDFSLEYNEEKINPYKECIIFLFIIFSYHKILSSPPIILYIVESLIILKFGFKYNDYIKNIFNEIDIIFEKHKNKRDYLFEYIKDISLAFTFLIIYYYIFQIIIALIIYYDIIFMLKIIILLIKITSRMMIILMIILLYIIFEKYYE